MQRFIGILGAFGKALLAIVIMIAAVFVADIIMTIAGFDNETYEGLFMTIYAIAMILMFYVIMTKTGIINSRKKLRKTPLDPLDVFWLFVIALGMLGLTTIYLVIANAIGEVNSEVNEAVEEYNESMERATEEEIVLIPNWDHWLYFFSSFVLIPLAEELMFRAFVLEGFAKHVRPAIAILLSSIIFGLLHGISVQIGYALICGLFLGAVYMVCDNILASYLVHATFNLFGAALYTLIDSGAIGDVSESMQNSIFGAMFMMEMGAILALFPSFYFLCLRHNKVFKPNHKFAPIMRDDYHYTNDEPDEGYYV